LVLSGTPGTARVLECYGCCGTAEGLRRCGLSCADVYVSSSSGSNECPAGSVRIETEAACRTAAATVGKTFFAVQTHPNYPRGCYYNINTAWLNADYRGAGDSSYQLLCAGARA
jgi:hypothetical protein